jgi:hypothetical protein
MAALRQVFDTNHNGLLDSGDDRWGDFRIWRDANGDGTSQSGEVKTLDALGITSIGLEPSGPTQRFSDGSAIQGLASFTRTDGTTGVAGDVSLAYQSERVGGGADLFKQAIQFASAMSSFGASGSAISHDELGAKADDFVSLAGYQPSLQKQALSAGSSSLTAF